MKPRSPAYMVLFASGDAGFLGASGDVLEHLAASGYPVVAFDSGEMVAPLKRSNTRLEIPAAAEQVDSILKQSRRGLGLPETTPVIVTGFSRGANLVVLAAGVPRLQDDLVGAIAIALTRETDFLKAPDPAYRSAAIRVDDQGRIQTYPAIALAGSLPFAVIQSAGDKYVPALEARRLFGPDGATRRLYEVAARNHGFGGGRDELLRDLDDALGWIEGSQKAR